MLRDLYYANDLYFAIAIALHLCYIRSSMDNIEWQILPRGDVAAHWSGLYVTMNKIGSIVLSRVTHERLGSPECYLIMFDRFNQRLALKPARRGTPNAYPARNYGRRGARIVRAFRIVTEFGIRPPDTIEFQQPKIDLDGQLILNLRDAIISPKAWSQCRSNPDNAQFGKGRTK